MKGIFASIVLFFVFVSSRTYSAMQTMVFDAGQANASVTKIEEEKIGIIVDFGLSDLTDQEVNQIIDTAVKFLEDCQKIITIVTHQHLDHYSHIRKLKNKLQFFHTPPFEIDITFIGGKRVPGKTPKELMDIQNAWFCQVKEFGKMISYTKVETPKTTTSPTIEYFEQRNLLTHDFILNMFKTNTFQFILPKYSVGNDVHDQNLIVKITKGNEAILILGDASAKLINAVSSTCHILDQDFPFPPITGSSPSSIASTPPPSTTAFSQIAISTQLATAYSSSSTISPQSTPQQPSAAAPTGSAEGFPSYSSLVTSPPGIYSPQAPISPGFTLSSPQMYSSPLVNVSVVIPSHHGSNADGELTTLWDNMKRYRHKPWLTIISSDPKGKDKLPKSKSIKDLNFPSTTFTRNSFSCSPHIVSASYILETPKVIDIPLCDFEQQVALPVFCTSNAKIGYKVIIDSSSFVMMHEIPILEAYYTSMSPSPSTILSSHSGTFQPTASTSSSFSSLSSATSFQPQLLYYFSSVSSPTELASSSSTPASSSSQTGTLLTPYKTVNFRELMELNLLYLEKTQGINLTTLEANLQTVQGLLQTLHSGNQKY